jgi:hypothetical protein
LIRISSREPAAKLAAEVPSCARTTVMESPDRAVTFTTSNVLPVLTNVA